MTCHDFIEFLDKYVSGEMPAGERSEFDRHLRDCPDCRAYLRSYEATIRLARGAYADPDGPLAEEVPEELVQAILAANRTRDASRRR